MLMVACAGAAYWMLTDKQFDLDTPQFSGDLRFVDRDALVGMSLLELRPNIVQLNTTELRRILLLQPALADAQVTARLPNHLDIALEERVPAFALYHGGSTFLVDADGLILASVDPAKPASLGLPVIKDFRSTPIELIQVGMTLDPIDLAAITQIGAVTPLLIDSGASALELQVRDDDGYVLLAQPSGWQAVFGTYTPNLRPTDIIPRQVQCLRSLLGSAEPEVRNIYLAPLDERCGTYEPSGTPTDAPRATPTPRPAR